MGSRNWPGKLDLMNVILIGGAEELPGKGPEYDCTGFWEPCFLRN